IIASLLALLRLQEHWINYRATAEALKTEKFLFLTQTQPYDTGDAFHFLVQRVEALLSKENTEWMQSMIKPSKEDSDAGDCHVFTVSAHRAREYLRRAS